eukprot:TRINITY_DN24583_c0_g1_i1.p1 TRINITY_DN24583_c0_g1~~TRINITY_DN24583_c0_g1_i1.p1  ORF type:complete len:174 (-),score=24.40 TRINITY_DN24583_c0_g1_i1:349-870(-)
MWRDTMAASAPTCLLSLPSALHNPSVAAFPSSRKVSLVLQSQGHGRTSRHKFQVLAVKNAPTKKGKPTALEPVASVIPEPEGYNDPKMPGDDPDFWEGPQWNWLGFTIEYMWALGIVFAIVACGIAVRTYNSGATDFKQTPVYKEGIEAQRGFTEDSSPGFADAPAEAPALED